MADNCVGCGSRLGTFSAGVRCRSCSAPYCPWCAAGAMYQTGILFKELAWRCSMCGTEQAPWSDLVSWARSQGML
jgi:hypothetical protein